jgi:uncharacterized repeat protein (TIGR01451 family)
VSRRHAAAAVILVVAPLLVTLTSCGSGNGQLAVSISGDSAPGYKAGNEATYAHYKPGELATFTVAVVNRGPGSVTGVTVHVLLPAPFQYHSTTSISAPGATRTQPVDAAVNSGAPIFGLWTLAPPGAAGGGQATQVVITFSADVEGKPGPATVQAFAAGDASAGQAEAGPYSVDVDAAAKLSALARVNPASANRGSSVQYEVRITNSGTGLAKNVGVLITLPPVLVFSGSVMPFAGNGSRSNGVDPIKNTLVVFYDGFSLPPISNGNPGFVVIVFKATVLGAGQQPGGTGVSAPPSSPPGTIPTGTYTVDASVTDDVGDAFNLHSVAPLNVT